MAYTASVMGISLASFTTDQGLVFHVVPQKVATSIAARPTREPMMRISLVLIAALGVAACDSDDIDSDEEARRAYFGLDDSIAKSLKLGFDGFNSAQSANISPQMTTGTVTGTLVVTGQVDQGASDNKGMRLRIGMVDYNDGPFVLTTEDGEEEIEVDITYDTDANVELQPYLQLSLRNIPNGTFTGTLTGVYFMTGDIEGEANLNLMFSGSLMADPANPGDMTKTVRVPGTTMVTGTAESGDGVFEVNLKI